LLAAANARAADHHGGNTATIELSSFRLAALMLAAMPATLIVRQSRIGNKRPMEAIPTSFQLTEGFRAILGPQE
jgi:hypothetical protein